MNSPSPSSRRGSKLDQAATLVGKRSSLNVKKLVALPLCALVLVIISASTSRAVTVTSNAVTGNWNAGTTWVGGKVPAAGDDVIIVPGASITVTETTHINSITFNNTAATARTLTVNSGIILNVTGAAGITLQNAAATSTNATIAGAGTVNCLSVTVGGTITDLTADGTTTLTSTISTLSISGNLTLSSEDDGGDENQATYNLESGVVTVGGTVNTDEESGSIVTLSLNTGSQSGTLSLAGATPFTDAVGTPTINAAGTTATVNYSGANQSVRSLTYTNLTLSGSGTKTLTAVTTTNDNVTISSGVTLDIAAFTLNLSSATATVNGTLDFTSSTGSLTNSGGGTSILTMGSTGLIRTVDQDGVGPTGGGANPALINPGGTFTTTSIDTNGTVEYNRNATSGQTVSDRDYNNLIITGSTQTKTWTRTATTRTVNGNVTINASAPFTLNGNFAVNVKGNWTNNGTFSTPTAVGSSVVFNGTTNQTIGGTSASTFGTLTIANTGTGDEVVSLTSAALTTVSTALNINDGVFDHGAFSNLRTGTVTILAAGTFRNFGTGDLELTGSLSNAGAVKFSANGSRCGDTDDILLRSFPSGTPRSWSGLGLFQLTDVDVLNQTAALGLITVRSGTDNGGNTNWVFLAACTLAGDTTTTYTWEPVVTGDWTLAANWSPDRTTPSSEDVLVIDGTPTPSPIITNVPTQEIAALRLINGASPTLQAGAANNTLTLSGRTGTDLSVPGAPSLSVLTLSGANALRIVIASGSTATVDGQIVFQDAAHRLLGDAVSSIFFHSGADFTTETGFTGNAFGSGNGAGNGVNTSVQFESGSQYFHNAGDSPFGVTGSGPVTVFQTGSEVVWLQNDIIAGGVGFQASGRTYATLVIGDGDPAVDVKDAGTGDFQFQNLIINSSPTEDSSLEFTGSGASRISIKGNITSAGTGFAGGSLADVSLTAGTGGIQIDGGGTSNFGFFFASPALSRSIFFGSNATVASGTTLNLNRVVQMGFSADGVVTDNGTINSVSSAGYVLGAVRRSGISGSYTFHVGTVKGYTPVALSSAIGGGDLTVRARAGNHSAVDDATSLDEYWTITLNSGALNTTLQFTYLDVDVDGTEANYKVVRIENGTPLHFALTSLNTGDNTASVTDIDHFSDWTLGEPVGATAVTFSKFKAVSFSDGVQLNWQSGFEVDNLGYHLYRENNGKRSRVNPSLVAGSALTVGTGNRMSAGYSYSWFDSEGTPETAYHVEAIDLDGSRQWAGPVFPAQAHGKASSKRRAKLLNELAPTSSDAAASAPFVTSMTTETKSSDSTNLTAANGSVTVQQTIAAGKAVKIQVQKSGWYRVTQPELVAAGFDSASDARLLQLFVDGQEVPISLSTEGSRLNASDSLEFYGVPLDTLTTDTRTYWLITGSTTGKRIAPARGKVKSTKDGQNGPSSFDATVERREKLSYISNLLNGESENIFGLPIFYDGVDQSLPITYLHSAGSQPRLEVALQGLTNQDHQVQLKINGTIVGSMNFTRREHPVQTFNVDRSVLIEGNNVVSLTSMNGESDISVIDWVRLTYPHQYRAENNKLTFTATGGQTVSIQGFSSPSVRIIDITNPNSPLPQIGSATSTNGAYTISVQVGGTGVRRLLALTDDLASHPAAITANQPSNWNAATNGADMVIITHKDFVQAIEPLANLRRSQGMSVAVVDVEDVFDEFSYGAHTPSALKAFLSSAAGSWQRKPKYLLLVGDSSWDPRNYLGEGANDFVPTKLIDTRNMETASDDWLVDSAGSGIPDLAIGRLPGRTPSEINQMVSKILTYEQEREVNAPLRSAVMVADTGFEQQNAQTGTQLPSNVTVQTINRSQVGNDDLMRGQIVDALNQGPMIVNYYGHGSVTVWTGEGVLDSDLASTLTNVNRPSLYVMMTCLNGYASDAYIDSLGEATLKAPNGAVAVWASSGFTTPQPQFLMNSEFYRLLFGGQPIRLGDAARNAKAATTDQDVRRTWTLLGDPAMRIR